MAADTTSASPERPEPESAPTSDSASSSTGAAVLLASLTAAAGVVHLVMAPIHAGSSGVEAAGFALSGWVQLALAALLLVRPARAVLGATAGINLALVVVWIVSRTVGLPVGEGGAEHVGAADLVTVALELGAVAVAVALAARPALLQRRSREVTALGALVPVAALLAVTLVVVSPSTVAHSHGDDPEPQTVEQQQAAFEASRCDRQFNPKAYWTEAEKVGVDTGKAPIVAPAAGGDHHGGGHGDATASTTTTTAPADPLGGRGSQKLDAIVSKLDGKGENDAAQVVAALADLSDTEYDAFLHQLRKRSAGHTAAHSVTGDDTGHGGHMGPTGWVPMTDKAQCDKLTQELTQARDTALRYPTAAEAEKGGWRKVTGYVPGIAAHYINARHVDGRFEIDKPEMLLYDGEGPEARIVGLSYYVVLAGEAQPTQGFTGDNDHYHRHVGLCIRGGMVVGASTLSDEECAAMGGRKAGGSGGWMNHVWVVPGCESPWGLFSGATPLLDVQLAEQSGKNEGGCSASKSRARYDLSPGTAPPPPPSSSGESASGR
jgi:hypothetical protein